MSRSRLFSTLLLAGALALTFGARSASADTTTITLTSSNLNASQFPGPYGTVTVTTTATGANITFTGGTFTDSSGHTCYYMFTGNGAVAVNLASGSLNTSSITGSLSGIPSTFQSNFSSPGPYSSGGAGEESGAGQFNTSINSFDGFQHSATSITFAVTGTFSSASSVLVANSLGNTVAAHIGVYCPDTDKGGFQATGFAGNGKPVPEPSTLALAGLGALGFIGYGLRRRLKK
jgi:hypothetical protein